MIKTRINANPNHFQKDRRLERVIAKYDRFLRRKEAKRRESIHEQKTARLSEAADLTPEENYQLQFMREVLYNYIDRELKIERVN